jgi:hypothetical protein
MVEKCINCGREDCQASKRWFEYNNLWNNADVTTEMLEAAEQKFNQAADACRDYMHDALKVDVPPQNWDNEPEHPGGDSGMSLLIDARNQVVLLTSLVDDLAGWIKEIDHPGMCYKHRENICDCGKDTLLERYAALRGSK